jgi:peroxiredoxin
VVNRVYKLFKEDKKLSNDVKIIGIGIGTQPEDLEGFRKAFKVEYPMFSDLKKEIQKKLNVQGVPLTILLDKNRKVLMSHVGLIANFDAFASEIKKNLPAK